MKRYELQSETLNRTAEMVEHPEGDYVKFSDIPPVPEPAQWLDKPDGEGLFWFIDESKPKNSPWLIDIDNNGDNSPLVYRTGSEEFVYLEDLKGKFQRIPQPTLPGEDAT